MRRAKLSRKKGVQICNSDVCIKKSFYAFAWLGNEVSFSALVDCSERAMSIFSVLGDWSASTWGRGVTASVPLRRSLSCMRGRRVSVVQAYLTCQRCSLSVNRSCPEPFPANLAFIQRAWRALCYPGLALALHWGIVPGKPVAATPEGREQYGLPSSHHHAPEVVWTSKHILCSLNLFFCISKMKIMGCHLQH